MKRQLNTISAFQIFQLVRYATLILTGIVFTKTALTQTAIGEYETFLFIAGAVSFFWLNGLLKALLPLTSKNDKSNFFSAFVVIQSFSILAAALLFLFQPLLVKYLLNGSAITEPALLLLFIVFGVPASMAEYYYLIKKRNRAIVIFSLISFSVQFVLVVLPPVLGYGIEWALTGLVVSSLLRYLWLWIIFISNSEINFSPVFVKKHLKLGAPLVAAALLSGSAQYVDGFIITSKFSEDVFAVFRYGARELPLAMLLANALSNAMLPEFAGGENLKKSIVKLKGSVAKLMHILFPLTIVLLLITHSVFPVIFNPAFSKSATVFNIYLLLVISRLLMPQTILNGLKITKPIMYAAFFELIINVILSLIFVNLWGIAGVAFATFVAYLFEKIYLAFVVKSKLNISLSDYVPVNKYLIYSFAVLVIFIFVEIYFV